MKEYLLMHFVYDAAHPPLVKPHPPRPEQGLEFFPKGLVTSVYPQTGEVKKEPRNAIFGQQVSRVNFLVPAQDYVVFRVIFHTGGLFRLLRIPLSEFTDRKTDSEAVINQEVWAVNDRLANTSTYADMVAIVEQYLLSKIRLVKTDIHAVDKIGQILLHQPTRFSLDWPRLDWPRLDWLADQACLSPRQLERKFVERMGIGPKLFSRISRFHQAFMWKEANPQADWLTVAVNFGYTDFHHLFKDFKEFAGVTPNTLLSEHALSPEKILRLPEKRRFYTQTVPGRADIFVKKNTTMTTTQTLEQTIRDLEKAETVAFLNEDFDDLNAIWHPDCSVNTPLNIILKTADIQGAMRAGLIRYSFLERVIEQVMIHTGIVVTLGHEIAIPIDNAPMAGQKITRRCTNIWVPDGNTWRMFSRHASNVTEPS